MRPIRPEDAAEHHAFIARLTPEDIRFRFFGALRDVLPEEMARFTQIDYDREMAFIASAETEGGGRETLGVVRAVMDLERRTAEFAIVVRSDLKGQGLGWRLLHKMIAYGRTRGVATLIGQVLRENHAMLAFVRDMGFTLRDLPRDPTVVEVALDVAPTV